MAPLVKAPVEGDLLKFDLNHNYTREAVTLLEGTNYPIGAVLGRNGTTGKYKLSQDDAADPDVGDQVAAGVLIEPVDATDGDRTGVIIKRGPAIVSRGELVFDASVDDGTKEAAKIAQLTAIGIVTRQNA